MKKFILIISLFISSIFLVSCGDRYHYVEGKINITATTNIMADLALQIGGDKVSIYPLMKAGVDPHVYIARPGDFKALDKADFILVSGLHLEGKMVDTINQYKIRGNKEVLIIGEGFLNESSKELKDRLIEDDNFGGNYDPHFWFDIVLYKEAARILFKSLSKYDSTNKKYYNKNYLSYLEELTKLEEYVEKEIAKINENERILVSAHDAFEYFGRDNGFEVASLQGLSTESEVSPADLQEVVDIIIKRNVKAIFPETSVSPTNIQAVFESLKRENHHVIIGGNLYSDSIGDQDDDNTYIKMYMKNVNTIVTAFNS